MPESGIREITEPIELRLVEDRMHFTCVSGGRRTTYSVSLHKAANAAMCAAVMLDKHRSRVLPDNVREFIRKQ
jgi:hypothetical protein